MTDTPPDRPPPDRLPYESPWDVLRQLTAARIGLARSGASLATAPLLDFRLAHGRARDAVHEPLDAARLASALAGLSDPVVTVASAAVTRSDYLLRPDLGRALAAGAAADLSSHAGRYDVAFVVADGLSARAVQSHAQPVLAGVVEKLRAASSQLSSSPPVWRIAPLVIVRHGRVAIGDAVANALGADCVATLIGERPGLSAADSMGAYLTFRPQAGTTDADRNCISNIRPEGLGYADAAFKIAAMLSAMRAAGISGVRLKDDTERLLGDGA
jgi:ethanolamine ammonia-lyase small subunit